MMLQASFESPPETPQEAKIPRLRLSNAAGQLAREISRTLTPPSLPAEPTCPSPAASPTCASPSTLGPDICAGSVLGNSELGCLGTEEGHTDEWDATTGEDVQYLRATVGSSPLWDSRRAQCASEIVVLDGHMPSLQAQLAYERSDGYGAHSYAATYDDVGEEQEVTLAPGIRGQGGGLGPGAGLTEVVGPAGVPVHTRAASAPPGGCCAPGSRAVAPPPADVVAVHCAPDDVQQPVCLPYSPAGVATHTGARPLAPPPADVVALHCAPDDEQEPVCLPYASSPRWTACSAALTHSTLLRLQRPTGGDAESREPSSPGSGSYISV